MRSASKKATCASAMASWIFVSSKAASLASKSALDASSFCARLTWGNRVNGGRGKSGVSGWVDRVVKGAVRERLSSIGYVRRCITRVCIKGVRMTDQIGGTSG